MDGRLGLGALCRGKTELERGDQREAAQRRCCQIAVLPCQGTHPSIYRFLFLSIQQSFSTAFFSISGEMTSGGRH